MSLINNLPEIEFASKSPAQIKADLLAKTESEYGQVIQPADPRFLFLNVMAYTVTLLRSNIDYAAKQNLLAYATDVYLDHLGKQFKCTRLTNTKSIVSIRFVLSAPQAVAVVIPNGTRVTSDSNVFFATKYIEIIPAGSMSIDVECEAMTGGSIGNNYPIGTINTLVDPIPFVSAVTNLDISATGADNELDDAYRLRIFDAMEQYSAAGSKASYRYWAKTATANIIDCHVYKNAPGEVTIIPLMTGGTMPTASELTLILNACNDEEVRPTTDLVHVIAPTVKQFDIDIGYYVDSTNTNSVIQIQQNIDNAILDYISWQTTKINRDINPDELITRIKQAGAKRVVVNQPLFTVVQDTEVPQLNNKLVNFLGLEHS